MLVGETIAVAFQSIRANKLRAGLTMLGIIIIVSEHRTARAAWTACNRCKRETAAVWGHKLYGPRFHVIGPDGFVPMHDLEDLFRRKSR